MHDVPLIIQFSLTVVAVFVCIRIGYWVGAYIKKKQKLEKENLTNIITNSVLGLLAFLLAFTFNTVTNRYDKRKTLVREEASQIYTAFLRTNFLPTNSQPESKKLIKEYLDLRIDLVTKNEIKDIEYTIVRSQQIQDRLWEIASSYAGSDMRIGIGSQYYEGLTKLFEIQNLRVSVGYKEHVPEGIWIILYVLLAIGMFTIGYHSAIIESYRLVAVFLIAIAFALVFVVISSMDDPRTTLFKVPQQALIDMQLRLSEK